jgi:hypothetical protein
MSDAEPDEGPEPVQDADAEGDPEGEPKPVTNMRTRTVPFQVS